MPRDLQNILSGGQISGINLNGTGSEHAVPAKGYIDGALLGKADISYVDAEIAKKTYDFVQASDIIVTSTGFIRVLQLVKHGMPMGIYEVKFSYTFSYDSVQRSAIFSWSINEGLTWEEFSVEPKDKSDTRTVTYEFPWVFPGGDVGIMLDAKCEGSGDELDIKYANIVLERKV